MITDIQVQNVITVPTEEITIIQDAQLLHVGGGSTSGCLV